MAGERLRVRPGRRRRSGGTPPPRKARASPRSRTSRGAGPPAVTQDPTTNRHGCSRLRRLPSPTRTLDTPPVSPRSARGRDRRSAAPPSPDTRRSRGTPHPDGGGRGWHPDRWNPTATNRPPVMQGHPRTEQTVCTAGVEACGAEPLLNLSPRRPVESQRLLDRRAVAAPHPDRALGAAARTAFRQRRPPGHRHVAQLRLLAERGDANAQAELGVRYEAGRGIERDFGEAVSRYRRAAEQGHAAAQAYRGFMYSAGRGVGRDVEAAIRWYRRSAEQGDSLGQNNLGVMYRDGRGVGRDDEAAVRWFRRAAEQGHARGQGNLGWMHREGRGVGRDDEEAVRLFRQAADQGLAIAQTNLGWMYEQGRGVRRDRLEAARWYRLAADQGACRRTEETRRPSLTSTWPSAAHPARRIISSDGGTAGLRSRGGMSGGWREAGAPPPRVLRIPNARPAGAEHAPSLRARRSSRSRRSSASRSDSRPWRRSPPCRTRPDRCPERSPRPRGGSS